MKRGEQPHAAFFRDEQPNFPFRSCAAKALSFSLRTPNCASQVSDDSGFEGLSRAAPCRHVHAARVSNGHVPTCHLGPLLGEYRKQR